MTLNQPALTALFTMLRDGGHLKVKYGRRLADVAYPDRRSRGSGIERKFPATGMIVASSSMRSLGEIAHGITSKLLTRAAGVLIQEMP
jgi:4-hydroxy-3-polyprenylbenzoate decarboxylase